MALPTLIDFLHKKGITIEDNPNARIDDSVLDIIVKEYQTDRAQKTKSDNLSGERHKPRDRQPEQRQAPEIRIEAPVQQGPKVVGHIDARWSRSLPDRPQSLWRRKRPASLKRL